MKAPQYIRGTTPPPQPLRRCILVVDISHSMADPMDKSGNSKLDAARAAVVEFAAGAMRGGPLELQLLTFAGKVWNHHRPGELTSAAEVEAVVSTWSTKDDTNIGDALRAVTKLLRPGQPNEVVLLSDGEDQANQDPWGAAKQLKAAGNHIVHTIGIAPTPDKVDEKLLRAIASTGAQGEPLYRFIWDRDSLIEHYGPLGTGMTE